MCLQHTLSLTNTHTWPWAWRCCCAEVAGRYCMKACCSCSYSTSGAHLSLSPFSPIPSNSPFLGPLSTLFSPFFPPLHTLFLFLPLSISCTLPGFHGDSCALQKSHWSEYEIEGASFFYTWTHTPAHSHMHIQPICGAMLLVVSSRDATPVYEQT